VKELFTIIPNLPGVRVFEFAKDYETSANLAKFCQEQGHYLEIVAFEEELFNSLKDLEGVKVRNIPLQKERYNQRSVMFDTIFINYPLEKIPNLEEFLKKVYRMSKNGGDIILFVPKEELEKYEKLLQDVNFVAINPIEGEGYLALSAKKLHGWTKV